jgi:hypothetical protein
MKLERDLQRPCVVDGRDLLERRRWIPGVRAGAEYSVQSNAVEVVGEIESFGERLHAEPLANPETAAEAGAQAEEVESRSGVAIDERSVDGGPGGSPLDRIGAGGDVER